MRKAFSLGLAFVVLLLFWQGGSMMIDKSFLPGPGESFASFFSLLGAGTLNKHLLISAYRVLAGMALALLVALPIGIGMGTSKRIKTWLSPLLYILYPIPKVVFLPVIVVVFGLGDGPKVFLIALVLFFQLVVVIKDAAAAIPAAQKRAMRSLGATRLETLGHLVLPACVPGILTALRASLGTAIAILFVAETFASFDGLGYYITNQMDSRDYLAMYAGIIALAAFGGLLYGLLGVAERLLCHWYVAMRRG